MRNVANRVGETRGLEVGFGFERDCGCVLEGKGCTERGNEEDDPTFAGCPWLWEMVGTEETQSF